MKSHRLGSYRSAGLKTKVWITAATLLILLCLQGSSEGRWTPPDTTVIRHVGISRIGGQTQLTVILSRPTASKIISRITTGKPRLIIDFPKAQAGSLPAEQFGDDILVRKVLTEVSPSGRGVRIILEMVPGKPYSWWRQSRPLKDGQTIFMVGLKPDPSRAQPLTPPRTPEPPREMAERLPEPTPKPQWSPPPQKMAERLPEPTPKPQWTPPPSGPPPAPGGFPELRYLVPQAASLWQALQKDGWMIAEAKNYDRPGKRLTRTFRLTNGRYPDIVINIAHIPANTPGAPNINIVDLDFENLNSKAAREYRELRKWNFAKIKKNFEDIGDFFDDALKPLRVELRKECQKLALRWTSLIENFVRHAAPQHAKAAEQVMARIKEKVNPRFDGVQFTISENPLLMLNLVDFLYIRVYYL